jgi:hypothetical protein
LAKNGLKSQNFHDFFSFSEFFWPSCKILPQKKIEIHTQKKKKQARSRLES